MAKGIPEAFRRQHKTRCSNGGGFLFSINIVIFEYPIKYLEYSITKERSCFFIISSSSSYSIIIVVVVTVKLLHYEKFYLYILPLHSY